ncbi:hypothetical protein E3J38_05330 [candidate division TA06 bacterium]|uniref:Uncharacterized protein n=1 Tax=candidate division TA06 bacterium TaxID=2250710 RepID=A0A523XMS1_UNCT6|nr:MAG: hypothetical protein E3J38_05330 [candidate division TA06 bacterium]
MRAEKWLLVGGQVFRLERASMNLREAIQLASDLSQERQVVAKKSWANKSVVYWRHKKDRSMCPSFTESLIENERAY